MNNLTLKLSAVAVAAMLATGVQANGLVSPGSGAFDGVLYAMEAITPSTAVTLPNIVYTMKVGRATTGQDITIIYTLTGSATFSGTPAAPTYARGTTCVGSCAVPVVTFKRGGGGTQQAVYSVTIDPTGPSTTGLLANDTFTLVAPVILPGATSLAAEGAVQSLTVTVLDQVETACVDNAGIPSNCFLTSNPAKLARASDFSKNGNNTFLSTGYGVTADTGTTTDVNASVPLAGFVQESDGGGAGDTPTIANAAVHVQTKTTSVRNPGNTDDYSLVAGDIVTITVTDPTSFLGLAPSGFNYAVNGTTNFVAPTVASGFTTFHTFPGTTTGFNVNAMFTYASDLTTPMGVSRVLSVAGSVAPGGTGTPTGIGHAFLGNSTWWTWGSNGTILETPMMNSQAGGAYLNRFVFMNYSTNEVSYSAACLVETGRTVAEGTAATGHLWAGKQTVVMAADVCTIAQGTAPNAAQRGAVRFTINSPASVVKGVYNVVQNTGAVDSIEMLPPRTTPTPTPAP